jgi:hypothetical protein
MQKRLKIAGLITAGMIAAGLAIDYAVVRHKERSLAAAVLECGGQMGSIPAWPIGTEYRITFDHALDEKQLHRLDIANQMRGWKGVVFRDCELSNEDRTRMSAAFANCHLFIIRDGRMDPMHPHENVPDELP